MKRSMIALTTLLLTLTACQESLEDRCEREARDYTAKHCPMTIAKDVVMDSMTFDRSTSTIAYVYALSGALDDTAVINRQQLDKTLLDQLRNTPNLKLYKEAGYSFRYVYYSTKDKGHKLFDTTFHQKDYQ